MSGTNDDDAWRAIVENYGDRPQVEDPPAPAPEPEPFNPTYAEVDRVEEERFVPPPVPPAPRLDLPRHLPWLGVFGIPAFLLVSLLVGASLPSWLGYLMVVGFVVSFVYLVVTMQRRRDDPWDDGARV